MHAQPAIIPDPPATCDGEVQHAQEQPPSRGKKAEKHAMQHRGMLRELRTLCKGDESTVFVELGAGNGGLTSAVSEWATTSSLFSSTGPNRKRRLMPLCAGAGLAWRAISSTCGTFGCAACPNSGGILARLAHLLTWRRPLPRTLTLH